MERCSKTLILILGPTGVGKTELSLQVAEHYGCPIVNCDSRQVFKSIPVGTAAPTSEEQARVQHYFVATRELEEDYNAGQYERDALELLNRLFQTHDTVVMTGGSMLYADAVCYGLDDLPTVPAQIRLYENLIDEEKAEETGSVYDEEGNRLFKENTAFFSQNLA